MQVRHIEEAQLQLEHIKKVQGEELLAPEQEKPWEEVVECLAVLAAIHAGPCQTAQQRDEKEKAKSEPRATDPE